MIFSDRSLLGFFTFSLLISSSPSIAAEGCLIHLAMAQDITELGLDWDVLANREIITEYRDPETGRVLWISRRTPNQRGYTVERQRHFYPNGRLARDVEIKRLVLASKVETGDSIHEGYVKEINFENKVSNLFGEGLGLPVHKSLKISNLKGIAILEAHLSGDGLRQGNAIVRDSSGVPLVELNYAAGELISGMLMMDLKRLPTHFVISEGTGYITIYKDSVGRISINAVDGRNPTQETAFYRLKTESWSLDSQGKISLNLK